MFLAFLCYSFLNVWKLLFSRRGKLEQLEYKDGERAGSCGRARRLLNAVADHSRGYTVREITMPSFIISILGIYNVENPIQINKQTISSWGEADTQLSQPNQRQRICISKKQLSTREPVLYCFRKPSTWSEPPPPKHGSPPNSPNSCGLGLGITGGRPKSPSSPFSQSDLSWGWREGTHLS